MHDLFHQNNNNNNFNIIENELMHSIYIMNLWMKLILNFAAYSEWRLSVTFAKLRDLSPGLPGARRLSASENLYNFANYKNLAIENWNVMMITKNF